MSSKSAQRDMTTGTIWKEIFIFFLPIVAGTLFQQLYNAADAIIVGKFVGTEALAAVGGSPAVIINLEISIFVSLTTGSSVIIAQLYGAGFKKDLKRATGTAMVFFGLLGVCMTLSLEPLTYWMLEALDTPADTVESAATYLHICFAAAPALMLVNAQSGILRAVGDSRSPFIYMLISCLANIVLDLVFVIFLDMKVAGVALATVISIVINMILTTVKLVRTQEAYRIDVHELKIDKHLLGDMMQLGIPAALQGAMYGVSNMIIQVSVNALGTNVVAAWALSGKVDGIYWATSNAAGSAITTFAGQNYGAKKMDRVFDSMKQSLLLFMPISAAIELVVLLFAGRVLPFFTDDLEVIEITKKIFEYIVPYYLFWTFIEVASGILRGCGDVRMPVVITGIGICLFRTVWIMTVCRWDNSLFNLCIIYAISWAVTAVALMLYFFRWKKKTTLKMLAEKKKATAEENA